MPHLFDESSLSSRQEQQFLLTPNREESPLISSIPVENSSSQSATKNPFSMFAAQTNQQNSQEMQNLAPNTQQLFTPGPVISGQHNFSQSLDTHSQKTLSPAPINNFTPQVNSAPAPICFSPNSANIQTQASISIDLGGDKWNENGIPSGSLNTIWNSVVYDEVGNRHEMSSLWAEFKTIFIFTRNAQVRMVVITPSHWKHLREFRKLTRYPYLLFSDMDQGIYNRLGFNKINDLGGNGDSPHVKSGNFGGVFSTMRRAFSSADNNHGPRDQQGGQLIVGPGPYLHFSHVDKTARDHYSINGLLNKVGIQAINFPHQYQQSKNF